MELSTTQQKKLKILQAVKTKGLPAILEYLFELEDKLEQEVPALKDVIERVKGEDGDKGEKGDKGDKGEDGRDGIDGQDGRDGKDGKDGKNGRDGRDGITPDVSTVALKASKLAQEAIKPLIPTIEPLDQEIPKYGEAVRDSLELLQGEERLDKSAIKGLDEEFSRLEKKISTSGGGASRGMVIRRHDLTSQCDGATKSFTLPIKTVDVIGVFGTQFPLNFSPTNDWTFIGGTLTLGDSVSAPESGQTLWVLIESL